MSRVTVSAGNKTSTTRRRSLSWLWPCSGGVVAGNGAVSGRVAGLYRGTRVDLVAWWPATAPSTAVSPVSTVVSSLAPAAWWPATAPPVARRRSLRGQPACSGSSVAASPISTCPAWLWRPDGRQRHRQRPRRRSLPWHPAWLRRPCRRQRHRQRPVASRYLASSRQRHRQRPVAGRYGGNQPAPAARVAGKRHRQRPSRPVSTVVSSLALAAWSPVTVSSPAPALAPGNATAPSRSRP